MAFCSIASIPPCRMAARHDEADPRTITSRAAISVAQACGVSDRCRRAVLHPGEAASCCCSPPGRAPSIIATHPRSAFGTTREASGLAWRPHWRALSVRGWCHRVLDLCEASSRSVDLLGHENPLDIRICPRLVFRNVQRSAACAARRLEGDEPLHEPGVGPADRAAFAEAGEGLAQRKAELPHHVGHRNGARP